MRCLLLCSRNDTADHSNVRSPLGNSQSVARRNLILQKRNQEESTSLDPSCFPLPVNCFPFGRGNAPRPFNRHKETQVLHPEVWWFTALQESGVGEITTKKERRHLWESEKVDEGFVPKESTVTSHSPTHPCPPIINRPHHTYGTSTLCMRKTDAEERQFMPWGFRIWLKGIKELRRPAVLDDTKNRV